MHTESARLLQQVVERKAQERVQGWIGGAWALALLHAAAQAGLLEALRAPRSAEQIAALTGLDAGRVRLACQALEAHGAVRRADAAYVLAPDLLVLAAPDAAMPLADLLGAALTLTQQLGAALERAESYTGLPAEAVQAIARGEGGDAHSPRWLEQLAEIAQALPALGALWADGARHIELGCGAGGTLLGLLRLYPALRAVGVEINSAVLDETRRRAEALGLAGRLELRHTDARLLDEPAAYDTAFWGHLYFPSASRPAVLAALRRALRPGGYLLLPLFRTVDQAHLATPLGRKHSLLELLAASWGITTLGEPELCAELEAAGFEVVSRMRTRESGLLIVRRAPAPHPEA